jgi:hypothetical protein
MTIQKKKISESFIDSFKKRLRIDSFKKRKKNMITRRASELGLGSV